MTSVFIGGSRNINHMNTLITHRLENIIRGNLHVLIGDANGFDRLVQSFFAKNHYPSVIVYCTNGQCRNNVGNWPLHVVPYNGPHRGLALYTAKDDAMLQDASYGLFGWDGKSKGTYRNIHLMAERGKPSAVYVAPIEAFVTVHSSRDVSRLPPGM
jgi:hypothetical protein